MSTASKRFKDGDEADTQFTGVEKIAVLRECDIFNDRNLDAVRCISVLTKLAYLLAQGETFSSSELTNMFFAMTKLFQSPDIHLRRMVYLLIKELQVGSDESMIVINCLQKDMNSDISSFRANSICVLAKIMDPSMVSGIERFLRQALVDRNPFIVASTMVAGHTLLKENPEIVKRWTSEIQEGLNNNCKMVQYHALSLLYKLKRHDKLGLSKVATALARKPPIGAQSQCVVIRMIYNLLSGYTTVPDSMAPLLQYIVDCLHNRSFMVMYEAARAMCRLQCLTPVQLAPAVCVLQEFLSSPIPVQRFAAVRTLSEAVMRYPMIVAPCSGELETCINDSNRSIATLAVSTLLKTGVEANVDRLMKTIIGFMSEISDEFKIVLVDAIQTLCLKFPHKHGTLNQFLASSLREEGGLKFKEAIVKAMLTIMERVPEALETGLEHFCEFIEDCEFASLAVQVLHFLGTQASKASNPAKFIRFIFNRVILEEASVRSAAVTALGQIGASIPDLRDNIVVLLRRCINDVDDEVRDRVVLFLEMLSNRSQAGLVAPLVFGDLPVGWADLERSLQTYLENDEKVPFNLTTHLVKAEEPTANAATPAGRNTVAGQGVDIYEDILSKIPDIKRLGKCFASSQPVALTEEESEFVVSCVKHVFARHAVFQFNVENKMEDTLLEKVMVDMELDEDNEDWMFEFAVEEKAILHGESGITFVCFSRPEDSYNSHTIVSTLKFISKEVYGENDYEERGQRDECELDEIEIAEADFMKLGPVMGLPEFKQEWESLSGKECVKRYALGLTSVQAAVDAVLGLVNMRPCEDTHIVPEGAPSHGIQLTGQFVGNVQVFCRAAFRLNAAGTGVTLAIAVRSTDPAVSTLIANAVR